jgi:adenine-specific DNA-methyltransferase
MEESENWPDTGNIYIKGDSIDALKLLREEFLGKVRLIYIDPPYNTGRPMLYADSRTHARWCSMMFPRLILARELLAENGAIFISIDDNEQANLKKMCDEVFGEENFAAQFIWTKTATPPSLSRKCRRTAEYVLCFEKAASVEKFFGAFADNGDAPLLNTGNAARALEFPPGAIDFAYIKEGIINSGTYGRVEVENGIIVREGRNANSVRLIGAFKWRQATVDAEIKSGTRFLVKTESFSIRFQRPPGQVYKPPNNLFVGLKPDYWDLEFNRDTGVDTNERAARELAALGLDKCFSFAKPLSLITKIIKTTCNFDKEAIILDFFSGSATTGHAVMRLNAEDGGCRRFILVQAPEKCPEHSEAFKAGFKDICQLGLERLRRAGALDTGFRVFEVF